VNLRALDQLGIKRLIADSRQVQRGDTFVAYVGASQDGRRYISEAIRRGARSVLWEKRGFTWDAAWHVPNIGISALRANAGIIASHIYGDPSSRLQMIGVTGTNGKTTCSQWIAQALNRSGIRTAVIGTLGFGITSKLQPLVNTTPDALWLHARLADFERRGARAVSMEVSSIGLEQDRVAGVKFDIALFTNLTRDHLDYHRTMQRYRRAKARLFEFDSLTRAIFNLDDDFGRELARGVRRRGLKVLGYGFSACTKHMRRACVAGANLRTGARGMRFNVSTPWGRATIESPMIGAYNASNLLGCLATLLVSDIELDDAVAALGKLRQVPGRMQKLGGGRLPLVVIDYAHTPDALQKALGALREITDSEGRIICVFGCGGNRDPGKRPLMGKAATQYADLAIITSDNPRSEDPLAIISDIERGAGSNRPIEPDRRRAIARALREARRGDVVLIAGKGHETYQEAHGVRRPFSDVAVARAVLQKWRPK